VDRLQREGAQVGLTLVFVWNRNTDKLRESVAEELILHNLPDFTDR
jgi:hypothetical protein